MERELAILEQIQYNQYITQRDLAESTGLSVGTINFLIKKMIKTGLIKMEKLNAQKMRYILTPEGIAEKAIKTYQYIVKSYKNVFQIQQIITSIVNEQKEKGIEKIYLYGEEDEVYKLIKLILNELVINNNIKYEKINNLNELINNKNIMVLIWNEQSENLMHSYKINTINVLNNIM